MGRISCCEVHSAERVVPRNKNNFESRLVSLRFMWVTYVPIHLAPSVNTDCSSNSTPPELINVYKIRLTRNTRIRINNVQNTRANETNN